MLEWLTELDRCLFLAVNDGWSHPALDVFFTIITQFGQGLPVAVLGLLGFYCCDRKNFPKNYLVIGATLLLGGLFVQIIKHLIDRPRPFKDPALGIAQAEMIKTYLWGIIPRWNFPLHPTDPALTACASSLHVVWQKWGSHSFPSGHSATALGAAAAIYYVYRRKFWLLFIPAGLVMLSRVYLGVHFPIDVVVGGLIGMTTSLVLLRLWRPYTAMGYVRPATFAPTISPADSPLVLVVAGEASADTYAAGVIARLKEKCPGARFVGVGGEKATAAGLQAVAGAAELSIVGFTGVLTGLGVLRRIYRRLLKVMDEQQPDLLLCIDLPDFNLGLANQAKARGIPVLYYISPQFWAWRTGRLRVIADRIDHLVPAFPFEAAALKDAGVACSYFGHPIMDTLSKQATNRDEVRRSFGLDPRRPVLILAPGSRRNEIEHLGPVLAGAARLVQNGRPEVQIVISLAPTVDAERIKAIFAEQDTEPVFVPGRFYELLTCGDAGLITSGTATLEAALAGLPHAILYRGNWLNITIARRVVKVDKIGLPNIILGRFAFRELIQEECTPEAAAVQAEALLVGPEREQALASCREVREKLSGGAGAVDGRVAELILKLITQRRKGVSAANG